MRSQLIVRVRVRRSDITIRGNRSLATDPEPDDDPWLPAIDELTVPSSRVRPTKPVIRLASLVAAVVAVVGAGLVGHDGIVPEPGSGRDSAITMQGPLDVPASTREPRVASQRTGVAVEIVILLPGSGDVVLGSQVPVAGSVVVSGAPRGVNSPDEVQVTIIAGGAILGEATLPVVDDRYVGWVRVVAPVRGVGAEIRVRDPDAAGRTASSQEFVLQAGSSDGRAACALPQSPEERRPGSPTRRWRG